MKTIYPPIRFKFKIDKFIACIAIFAKENLPDLDKLKAVKLIYLADKYHLTRYGKPIVGDTYVRLDYGPVPSKALDIINDVQDNRPVSYESGKSNKDKFEEFLVIKKRRFGRYPIFLSKKDPDLNCLSESELEAIEETIKKYGQYSPIELIDITHKDSSWLKTAKNEEIDYRLFFDSEPGAKEGALEYMETLSEDFMLSIGIGFDD